MSVLISTYWHPKGVPIKQSLPNFWALWVYSRMTKILCAELWWLFWQIWRPIKSLTVSQIKLFEIREMLELFLTFKLLRFFWHFTESRHFRVKAVGGKAVPAAERLPTRGGRVLNLGREMARRWDWRRAGGFGPAGGSPFWPKLTLWIRRSLNFRL